MFQNAGGLEDLLTATTTNPSRALATYYGTGNMYTGGFPAPASDYASVTRPAALGLGVLAQGAFLATHARSDTSSPTKRGLFIVLQAVLRGAPRGAGERAAARHDDADDRRQHHARSLREAARVDRRHGSCAYCHKAFDPLGFGFEHFDEGGRYRAKEKTFDINASGHGRRAGRHTISFTDANELMTAIASQPIVHQCMSAYLAAYAYGSDEACLGASQVTALQSGSIGIAEAFARLASEPHFTQRSNQ